MEEAFSPEVMASEGHERHLVNSLLQLLVRVSKFAKLFGQHIFRFNFFHVLLIPVLIVTAPWAE